MDEQTPRQVRKPASSRKFFFDFAEQFPHISEEIFSNLRCKDLLKCCLVSKEWSKIIGQSEKCMAKIQIKLENFRKDNNKRTLLQSNRKYQNIVLRECKLDGFFADFFQKREGIWKHVEFFECSKDEVETYFPIIIRSLEKSVEKIYIGDTYVNDHRMIQNLAFPNLQKLRIFEETCHTNAMKMFAGCTTLERFRFSSQDEVGLVDDVEYIRRLLQGNVELKELELFSFFLEGLVDDNFLRSIPFKLKELRTNLYVLGEHMFRFLVTQRESLTALTMPKVDVNCLQVILRMPKLIEVTMGNFSFPTEWQTMFNPAAWNELQLPENSSIETLNDPLDWEGYKGAMKAIIKLLPNLKHFDVFTLNDETFKFLAENVSNLESLKCVKFQVTPQLVLDNPLPKLTSFNAALHEYSEEQIQLFLAAPLFHAACLTEPYLF